MLFATAAFFYNAIEEEQEFQNQIISSDVVDVDTDQLEEIESDELENPIQ